MRKLNPSILFSFVLIFGLTACDAVPSNPKSDIDETPAARVDLTPGSYEIMAKFEGQEEKRFDVVIFNENQAPNWKAVYLPMLQGRLKPNYPAPSFPANDYICNTAEIIEDGAKFKTTGECNIPSMGEATKFDIDGKQLETSFWIRFRLNGPRVSENGGEKLVIIKGSKVQ